MSQEFVCKRSAEPSRTTKQQESIFVKAVLGSVKCVWFAIHSCFQFSLILVFLSGATGCVSRTEKDVVVYSALDRDFATPILAGFERSVDNEIDVVSKFDVESTKTVGLVNTIISEGEKPGCDLFWNNEIMHTVRLQKLGMLAKRD